MNAVSAVLLDVWGTLWSDQPTISDEALRAQRGQRLRAAGVGAEQIVPLSAAVADCLRGADDLYYFNIWAAVERACLAAGVSGIAPEAVRHANSPPAQRLTRLLPGTRLLLETIRDLDLRCVIASNGIWRNEADYWNDFRAFKLADYIDAVVSSVDTIWRKPHHRFYEAALQATGVAPDRCVMVGNSETKDIVPAAEFGMRTIRVAIEDERPTATQANFTCHSLEEVAGVLRMLLA